MDIDWNKDKDIDMDIDTDKTWTQQFNHAGNLHAAKVMMNVFMREKNSSIWMTHAQKGSTIWKVLNGKNSQGTVLLIQKDT
jgi:hypothetical protein